VETRRHKGDSLNRANFCEHAPLGLNVITAA
jgi:hypothetical protein